MVVIDEQILNNRRTNFSRVFLSEFGDRMKVESTERSCVLFTKVTLLPIERKVLYVDSFRDLTSRCVCVCD